METKFLILGVFTGVSGVAAFVLNLGAVLTFIIRRHILLTPSGLLLFSMSSSDLLATIIAAPMVTIANLSGRWVFGDGGCQLYGFVMTWFGLSNIMHLALASFERYATIGKPLVWTTRVTNRVMTTVIVFLWVYAFIFSVLPIMGWSRYALEGFHTACSVDWQSPHSNHRYYTVLLFTFCFFLPLTVMMVSYGGALYAFKNMINRAERNWGNQSQATQATVLGQKKFTVVIAIMVVAYLLAWVPYALVSLVSIFGQIGLISPTAATIPSYLAKTSTLYNPLIYFYKYKKFRNELKHVPVYRALVRRQTRRIEALGMQ